MITAGFGWVRHGKVWTGRVRQGKDTHDMNNMYNMHNIYNIYDMARLGTVLSGQARRGIKFIERGLARFGWVRHGGVRLGKVSKLLRLGQVRSGSATCGEARRGLVTHGMARHGKVRNYVNQNLAWSGGVRCSKTRQGKVRDHTNQARYGLVGCSKVRLGRAGLGKARNQNLGREWRGLARCGKSRLGKGFEIFLNLRARLGCVRRRLVRLGVARLGEVRHGKAKTDTVWFGKAWLCVVGLG